MQILRSHSRPNESETLEEGPALGGFNKPSAHFDVLRIQATLNSETTWLSLQGSTGDIPVFKHSF